LKVSCSAVNQQDCLAASDVTAAAAIPAAAAAQFHLNGPAMLTAWRPTCPMKADCIDRL